MSRCSEPDSKRAEILCLGWNTWTRMAGSPAPGGNSRSESWTLSSLGLIATLGAMYPFQLWGEWTRRIGLVVQKRQHVREHEIGSL